MRVPSHSKKIRLYETNSTLQCRKLDSEPKDKKSGIKYFNKFMVRNWKKGVEEESNREIRELEIFGRLEALD